MKIRFISERRKFLKNAAAYGGFAALMGILGPRTAGLIKPPQRPEQSGPGYRLTAHVKKYYETARM